jgi:hypothetical protein
MTKTVITPKFVSDTFALKWYNIGKQYSQYTYRQGAINAAIDDGHQIDCWEKCAAFAAGHSGYEFKIETYKRYGYIPMGSDGFSAPSVNHASNEQEWGVSVATPEWENNFAGLSCITAMGKKAPVIYFTGLHVGHGSDGEPVVLPIKIKEVVANA